MMKLYGYFAGNLGDDLMLSLLLERYPKTRFYSPGWQRETEYLSGFPNFESRFLLQRKYGRPNHLWNLLTVSGWKDRYMDARVRRREENCRGSVYIGGSLYMEGADPAREAEKLKDGPLFVVGANFGPNPYAAEFRAYFARCAAVTFRDRASADLFSGVETVRYAPDVVLNLKLKPGEDRGTVLISVMDLTGRPGLSQWAGAYEDWMARLCRVCADRGLKPVLMAFCQSQGDEEAAKRIESRCGFPLEKLCYRGDPAPILEAYRHASRVIATRFHGMILAFCAERKVLALAYDPKITRVAADLHFNGVAGMEELGELSPEEALDRCALPEGLEEYKQAAAGQFAPLDEFLEGEKCRGSR